MHRSWLKWRNYILKNWSIRNKNIRNWKENLRSKGNWLKMPKDNMRN